METLNKCFENVCELDIIFHMDKVRFGRNFHTVAMRFVCQEIQRERTEYDQERFDVAFPNDVMFALSLFVSLCGRVFFHSPVLRLTLSSMRLSWEVSFLNPLRVKF